MPLSIWQRLRSLRYARDFWLRHWLMPWRLRGLSASAVERGLPQPADIPLARLPMALAQQQRLQSLLPLPWPALPLLAERESLTVMKWIDLLQAHRPAHWSDQTRWCSLDVGSKNASYAMGLASLAVACAPAQAELCLDAVELDGGRRYRDGYCRADYGHHFTSQAQHWLASCRLAPAQVRYLVSDVRRHQGCYDMITWLMPFVFADPHLAWGLPLQFYDPQAITDHVLQQLAPAGLMLMVHLNSEEFDAMTTLLIQANTPHRVLAHGALDDLWLYPDDRRQYRLLQRV